MIFKTFDIFLNDKEWDTSLFWKHSSALAFYQNSHTYTFNNDKVSITPSQLSKWSDLFYGEIDKTILKKAADRGTFLHKVAEWTLIGKDWQTIESPTPSETTKKKAVKVEAWVKTFLLNGTIVPLFSEVMLYSAIGNCAGTLDFFGYDTLKQCYIIIDFKTSEMDNKQFWKYHLQMVTYRQMIYENIRPKGRRLQKLKTYIVYFNDNVYMREVANENWIS